MANPCNIDNMEHLKIDPGLMKQLIEFLQEAKEQKHSGQGVAMINFHRGSPVSIKAGLMQWPSKATQLES